MRQLLDQIRRLACAGMLGLVAAGCAGPVTDGPHGWSPVQTSATPPRVLGWVHAEAARPAPVQRPAADSDPAAQRFWASLQVFDPSRLSRAEQEAIIARAVAEHEMRHP
jgi:hypothetical protein